MLVSYDSLHSTGFVEQEIQFYSWSYLYKNVRYPIKTPIPNVGIKKFQKTLNEQIHFICSPDTPLNTKYSYMVKCNFLIFSYRINYSVYSVETLYKFHTLFLLYKLLLTSYLPLDHLIQIDVFCWAYYDLVWLMFIS